MVFVVDAHYFGGLLFLMWWVIMLDSVVFLHTLLDEHYCGGLLCLMWWVIMLDVVGYYA